MTHVPIDRHVKASMPAVVTAAQEMQVGDPSVWHPNSYREWEARERTRAFLAAWSEQMKQEKDLRAMGAKVIFSLIGVQVAAAFGVVIAQGLGRLAIDSTVLQILVPSVLAEVFGLGFVVTKFLFSQSLRHGLDSLVQRARDAD